MGILQKVRSLFPRKTFTIDADHGGWIDTGWAWNYWQQGRTTSGGMNNIVYACVQSYAQAIAQLPAQHKRARPDGGSDIITTSAMYRVLRKPNAYQTRSDFMLNLVCGLLFEGNGYAVAVRDNRFEITQLHLVKPGQCSHYVTPEGEVFYHTSPDAITGIGEAMLVPARDMLHLRLHTPHDPLTGQTPIYAAAMAVTANNNIMGQQAKFFENMSRPSGVLTTEEKLTKEQADQLRERWGDYSQGLNSGKVPVLGWGIKWQPLSLNAADAQMIEALRFSVEDIARAYRVPLPMIGVVDGATYNNVYNLMSFWKAHGLGFLIEHIEQSMADLFRLAPADSLELDTDKLMRMDPQGRVDALTKGITGGLYAPNEARRKEGLPQVEGGDMPRVQQQMVPLDYEEPEPPPAPAPPAEPEPMDPEQERALVRAMIKQAIG